MINPLAPQPVERLAFLRIVLPLVILGFLFSRLRHAGHWIGSSGFHVPDLQRVDYRQPVYLPALPDPAAWAVAVALVVSGLALSAGFRTRSSGLVFAALLFYVALADRLAAFTVSKIAGVLALALAVSAAGARYGVDAWRHQRANPETDPVRVVPAGELRFLQLFLLVIYLGSGICKARGEWLERTDILWTHLHDSYQTPISHMLANVSPSWMWPVLQWATLVFEIGAPLWFTLAATRLPALGFGLLLHLGIGLFFGPVIWFSLVMMTLLLGGFAPVPWLRALLHRGPG